jgi:hypothetical protein
MKIHTTPDPAATSLPWKRPVFFLVALIATLSGFAVGRYRAGQHITHPAAQNPASERPTLPSTSSGTEVTPWESKWTAAHRGGNSPARAQLLGELLEELARTDPARAIRLAQDEKNWLVRDQLVASALRGWAAVAPDAASDWALGQPLLGERMKCVTAVLTGAVENPEAAMRVGMKVSQADPAAAGDYGHALVNAFVARTGDFASAVRFATSATYIDRQPYLLDSAFYQWSQYEPDAALAQLDQLSDPVARAAAMKGVLEGWANSEPQKLASYAQKLPEGEERSQALAIALPQWVGNDPEAALRWINDVDPHPDFDRGVAALALLPSMISHKPEAAMELSDSICDSAQRTLIKSNVFYQWAMRDPHAARRYAEATQNPEAREMLLADLATLAASTRN